LISELAEEAMEKGSDELASDIRNVSPESDISADEAKDYLDSLGEGETSEGSSSEKMDEPNHPEDTVSPEQVRPSDVDDNGQKYKTNGELNPNTGYDVNGYHYETDSESRIISWEGKSKYNPDAERDPKAQTDAGGQDRKEGDDGGHVVGRQLDGSPGNENMVPMRDTVNRGDYLKGENEIADAVKAGKEVYDSGKLEYDGDSKRPSKIEREYNIDDRRIEGRYDNVEGSQDLLDDVKGDISDDDYSSLSDMIGDMEEGGSEVSVTSVRKEYDTEGNLVSVTVGVRDETEGSKTYITYKPGETS
jgi:hypothetical protein